MKQLINQQIESTESTEVQTVNPDFPQLLHPNPTWSFLLSIFHPNTYQVAAITIANSGDNISVYIPLFAGQDFVNLGGYDTELEHELRKMNELYEWIGERLEERKKRFVILIGSNEIIPTRFAFIG